MQQKTAIGKGENHTSYRTIIPNSWITIIQKFNPKQYGKKIN